jgi:hypothetical protein
MLPKRVGVPKDDAFRGPQVIQGGDGDVLLPGQYLLGVLAGLDLGEIRLQILDPAQDHFGPFHRTDPFGRSPRQLQHVAVHGVIHYQDFHRFLPR